MPASDRAGLYALRAITYTNRSGDWPLFPSEQEAATQEGDYDQIARAVLGISLTATEAGGVREAIATLEANIEAEAGEAVRAAVPATLVDDVEAARVATNAALAPFTDAVANVSNRPDNASLRIFLTNELNVLVWHRNRARQGPGQDGHGCDRARLVHHHRSPRSCHSPRWSPAASASARSPEASRPSRH